MADVGEDEGGAGWGRVRNEAYTEFVGGAFEAEGDHWEGVGC